MHRLWHIPASSNMSFMVSSKREEGPRCASLASFHPPLWPPTWCHWSREMVPSALAAVTTSGAPQQRSLPSLSISGASCAQRHHHNWKFSYRLWLPCSLCCVCPHGMGAPQIQKGACFVSCTQHLNHPLRFCPDMEQVLPKCSRNE